MLINGKMEGIVDYVVNVIFFIELVLSEVDVYIWWGLCGVDILKLWKFLFFFCYFDESFRSFIIKFYIEDYGIDYG